MIYKYFLIFIISFSLEGNSNFTMQPALISLFNRRDSDELTNKETIKQHLWNIHFAEYGK